MWQKVVLTHRAVGSWCEIWNWMGHNDFLHFLKLIPWLMTAVIAQSTNYNDLLPPAPSIYTWLRGGNYNPWSETGHQSEIDGCWSFQTIVIVIWGRRHWTAAELGGIYKFILFFVSLSAIMSTCLVKFIDCKFDIIMKMG